MNDYIQRLLRRDSPTPLPWRILAVILLAAWARLSRLTWYSVDVDEAFSLFWANKPLSTLVPDLIALRGDPHPPAYYALLKPWLVLLGENEVGLRLFSAFAGVVLVALLYALGRELFAPRVGLMAALLAAFNPMLVYESLDGRMYMPAAAMVLAGTLALWRGVERGGGGRFLAAFLWLALACYSHIASALAVVALGTSLLLVVFVRGERRRLGSGLGVLVAVFVAYLPYAYNAWLNSGSGAEVDRLAPGFWQILRLAAEWPLFHRTAPPAPLATALVLLLWLALFCGVVGNRRNVRGAIWLLSALLVPLLLIVLLSQRQSFLQPKMFAITTLAPLMLGVGLVVEPGSRASPRPRPAFWARLPWLVILVVMGVEFQSYKALWQPHLQRENWRAAGDYLDTHAGPHDLALAHLHYFEEPLRFYWTGEIITPFGSRLRDDGEIARGLEPYLENTEVLWLVQSGQLYTDPENRLEKWLLARYPLVTSQYPQSISIRGFLLRPAGFSQLPGTNPLDLTFTNGPHVAGAWIDQKQLPARDTWLHPPSNWLHVILYATVAEYTLTLEDEPGNVWAGVLSRDGLAVEGDPGQVVRLDYDLNINPETPPGSYKVVLRQAGEEGNVPLADGGQDWVILDVIEITGQ